MIKIKEAFDNKKALIVYLMAGDPDLAASAEYILAVQEAGADMVEIGIPFSDPVAEGEAIQAAAERALQAGTRLDGVFDMADSIKGRMRIPSVFMTYLNPVFKFGYDRFFARCAQAGVGGVIIPDLPFEEQEEAKAPAREYGVEVISLVAPTSGTRVAEIARNAEGFIYLVSSMGVTGVRSGVNTGLEPIVKSIRKATCIPVAVGFGISSREHAEYYSSVADGIIVGSAAVSIVGQYGANARQALHDYIKSIIL